MSAEKPIYVTRPSLAPLSRYVAHLADIWETGVLTHNGPKVQQLEREIDQLLGVDKTVAVTNGTIAMQMALRALDVTEGEVITTPFSWVATCSSILWERCTPVFVDVDPTTFNIDPDLIEAAITKQTRAILAVHSFSCPCDVERIATIAKDHKLSVVYDGAHAFGVQFGGRSLLDWGDVSTTSFHATKIFNTGEGGAVFAGGALKERLQSLRFFGFDKEKAITDVGCNGKMTELHAALGLANLVEMHRDRGLEPREAEFKILLVQHGARKGDRVGTPLLSKPVDDGSTRIANTEHLPNLVVGLADRIIPGRPESPVATKPQDLDELRMSPGNQERQVGLEGTSGIIPMGERRAEKMPFHMVDSV